MKNLTIIILIMTCLNVVKAQNSITAIIKDKETKKALIGATCIIKNSVIGSATNKEGILQITGIPNGEQCLVFSYIGYSTKEIRYNFPLNKDTLINIYLVEDITLNTVTVYSTRTNNRIQEIPTRIEVLGNEEVVEETAINPGNISKLLGETSGIEVQHTSAISGNVNFRIQGLPGKYTQLLQDGFPMNSGYSSGLSLLQIPPLDLKQVEIIEGSASTLYGGDAIAGIVSLISKKPTENAEL